MSKLTDSIFVQAAAGEEAALNTIWDQYNPRLLRYLRSRGIRDADDIASQVWIDIARALSRFEGDDADFTSWIFTIARRRVIDEWRRKERRKEQPYEFVESASPNDAIRDRDELEWAVQMVRRLPPDQADAVLMRVLADMDISDIAAIMQTSEGNVRVLVHRGLQKLANLIGAEHLVTDAYLDAFTNTEEQT